MEDEEIEEELARRLAAAVSSFNGTVAVAHARGLKIEAELQRLETMMQRGLPVLIASVLREIKPP